MPSRADRRWAPSTTRGPSCAPCVTDRGGQGDEIALWSAGYATARGRAGPERHARMMAGDGSGDHDAGMLTADQLGQLDRTRGERSSTGCFLTFMIHHHKVRSPWFECVVRHGSGRAGEGLPVRLGCVRRPDHRDRPHAEVLAALLSRGAVNDALTFRFLRGLTS